MTHGELKNAVLIEIGSRPDILVWANPTGVARLGFKPPPHGQPEAIVRFGTPGAADVLGIQQREPWALPFAIEIKVGRDSQSEEQKRWQIQWESRGGLYIVAREVEAVITALWG